MCAKPYLIGIAGASGSGKTTLTHALLERFRQSGNRAISISIDDYYRDLAHLPFAEREAINFDHPDSLEAELLLHHLERLRLGISVEKPLYDFATHTRKEDTERIALADIVVVEGILALYWEALNAFYDLRLFVETDLDLCKQRRLERDIQERGRTAESVVTQYHTSVYPMYRRYVEPTALYADFRIEGIGTMQTAIDSIVERAALQKR